MVSSYDTGNGNGNGSSIARLPAPPKFSALPFTHLGSWGKDVLHGSRGTGLFVLEPKVSSSTRTASGISLISSATRSGDGMAMSVMGTGPCPGAPPGTLLTAIATSAGAMDLEVQRTVAPGTRATLLGSLAPGPASPSAFSGSAGLEYGDQYVHIKSSATLTAKPLINFSFGTGKQWAGETGCEKSVTGMMPVG
ncbi:hypothetical protein QJQ45_017855 [Haematococcus lacustris]|nr:hypothetical protein QJQ45_017855 [Haematococcus lacustris]